MINDELKELAENFFKTGSELLFQDGGVANTLFIQDQSGIMHILPAPWGSEEEKIMIAQKASAFAKSVNAPWVMMIGEMWIAEVDPDNVDINNIPKASTHPNKQEVLMLVVMEPDGKCYSISSAIKRATNGEPYTEGQEWNLGTDGAEMQMYLIPPWK